MSAKLLFASVEKKFQRLEIFFISFNFYAFIKQGKVYPIKYGLIGRREVKTKAIL